MLKKLRLAARFVGFQKSLRAIQYSLLRDWHDQARPAPGQPAPPSTPGKLLETNSTATGGVYKFQNSRLEIRFLAPDLVRITWGSAPQPPFYALHRTDWDPVAVEAGSAVEVQKVASRELQVELDPDGAIRFLSPEGRLLRQDLPPGFAGAGWIHRARLHPEERLYGLGERAGGLNLRGGSYRMWNTDPGGSYGPHDDPLYMTIPVAIGLHPGGSYLVFYENSHPGTVLVAEQIEAHFEGGSLRYYLAAGAPARTLARFMELTGRPPMPPRWALGYHQCRWGYKDESEIRAIVEAFKGHGLPLSAVHLDIDYMDGYRVFTVDPDRFPDLARLTSDLHAQGVKTVTILDPGVKRDPRYPVFDQGLERQVFLPAANGQPFTGVVWPGWAVFPDFSKPDARSWWGEHYSGLLKSGVDGFWHDMNEPTSFAAWGDPSLPGSLEHDMDGRGGLHLEAHNLYALLMARAGYEALRRLAPDRRPWLLTRSGWAGVQRYAWHWTGDTESSWQALRMTVRTVLGLSLSGIPFTGPDIGGFSGAPSPELFTRWFQMAAFMPFFRNHAAVGTPPREPWRFGEPYLEIARNFLQLRLHLDPYFYTLAWLAHTRGQPLVRPLFWPDCLNRRWIGTLLRTLKEPKRGRNLSSI